MVESTIRINHGQASRNNPYVCDKVVVVEGERGDTGTKYVTGEWSVTVGYKDTDNLVTPEQVDAHNWIYDVPHNDKVTTTFHNQSAKSISFVPVYVDMNGQFLGHIDDPHPHEFTSDKKPDLDTPLTDDNLDFATVTVQPYDEYVFCHLSIEDPTATEGFEIWDRNGELMLRLYFNFHDRP